MKEILSMNGIVKEFPGVKALKGVHLDLREGEVHALLGENGAGKSTLMKILTGSYQAEAGEIIYFGKQVEIDNPRKAQEMGINIVHQEINLMPDLTVAENIFVGFEIRNKRFPFVFDFAKMNSQAADILQEIGLHVPPTTITGKLSVAQRQMVAIARMLALNSKIVILDEPTAALASAEVDTLFGIIDKLKKKGIGIIYISHRLEELDVVADRVSVFRDGMYITTKEYSQTNKEELIALMVGRKLENQYPDHSAKKGKEILKINHLRTKQGLDVRNISLHEGEILGIYGLVGAGRTEFARALFGADRAETYDVILRGKSISVRNTADAVKHGLGYLTEDRKKDGLALGLDLENNISLANLKGFSRQGIMNTRTCEANAEEYISKLKIVTPSIYQFAKYLSGGNQQKVIIAKWLTRNASILIFDEPTRGIDVGARKEVYELLNRLVEAGVGVIVISSDLPEVIGVSDRILVMHDFHFTGELNKSEVTQEKLLKMAVE